MSQATKTAWISILALAGTVVSCALVYRPAVNHTMLWEDNELISGAALGNARSLTDCFSRPFLYNYYRPLTSASFLFERWAAGENPAVSHLTNLLLHLLTIPVLFVLIWMAFHRISAALFGAFLFAFQPVQMLPTAWIGGRTDTLCVLFSCLFGLSLVTAARSSGSRRHAWMLASWAAYAASILSKEQAIVLIILAPLAFWCFGDPASKAWRTWLPSCMPLLVIGMTFSAAWFILVPQLRQELPSGIADTIYRVGQTMCYFGSIFIAPTPGRLFTISLGDYEGLLSVICGLLVLAGGAALCLFCLPRAPEGAWFLCLALFAILPVSGIFPMASLPVGPYRAALSGIGVAGSFGWLFTQTKGWVLGPSSRSANSIRIGLGIAYAGVCVWLIIQGVTPFGSAVQINRTFVRYNPDSVFVRLELSESLLNEDRADEAAKLLYGIAYRHSTDAESPPGVVPQVYRLNMGDYDRYLARLCTTLAYKQYAKGNVAAARQSLDIAKFMIPEDGFVNLGLADYSLAIGDLSAARDALRRALYADQSMTDRRIQLANILIKLGRVSEARIELAECMRRDPRLKDIYLLQADVEWKSGNPGGARVALERGVRIGALSQEEARVHLTSRSFESTQ